MNPVKVICFFCLFCCLVSLRESPCHAAEEEPDRNVILHLDGLDGHLKDNVLTALAPLQEEGLPEKKLRRLFLKSDERIREALEPFGYYSATIQKKITGTETGWRADYQIDPGKPVLVGDIQISFGQLDAKRLFPDGVPFPLKKGGALNHELYEQGKKKLLSLLVAQGYIKANFHQARVEVFPERFSCRIILDVDTGEQYLFGDVIFKQDILREKLLVRYVNFERGEIYSDATLLRLEQILYKTGYFDSVRVRGDVAAAQGRYIPVEVKLGKPEHRNSYHVGVGWATDDGFRGKVGWKNKLLNSRGHTMSAEVQWAEKKTGFDVNYSVPVRDPQFDSVNFDVSRKDETWGDTDTILTRGGLFFGHEGTLLRYGGGLDLRHEDYEIADEDGSSFLTMPSCNLSLLYGDNPVNTRYGILLTGTLRGAVEDVLSDATLLQATASGKLILTILPGLRVIGKGSLGRIFTDDFSSVPPSLRYYAGGDLSVRGYAYNTLGPEDSDGNVIGGKYLVFGSVELEKMITDSWGVALFFDAGNALDELDEDLAEGTGVGFRYRLPFGQVRVDVASALSKDDRPLRLHVTIGGDL